MRGHLIQEEGVEKDMIMEMAKLLTDDEGQSMLHQAMEDFIHSEKPLRRVDVEEDEDEVDEWVESEDD